VIRNREHRIVVLIRTRDLGSEASIAYALQVAEQLSDEVEFMHAERAANEFTTCFSIVSGEGRLRHNSERVMRQMDDLLAVVAAP
jgi:hypothetical protein